MGNGWPQALLLVVLMLQYRLWLSGDGVRELARLSEAVERQQSRERGTQERNQQLIAEVADLKAGMAAIEERARSELGMIGRNETFYQVVPARPARMTTPSRPPAQHTRPPRADFRDSALSCAPHALLPRHSGRGQWPAICRARSQAIRRARKRDRHRTRARAVRGGSGLRRYRRRHRGGRRRLAADRRAPLAADRRAPPAASSARSRCAMHCARWPGARAMTTGSWCTTPRGRVSPPPICNCSSRAGGASGGRIVSRAAGRHREAGARAGHACDSRRCDRRSRRTVARGDAAGVPSRRAAARARSGARCAAHAHGRSAGHRVGGQRPRLVAGRRG